MILFFLPPPQTVAEKKKSAKSEAQRSSLRLLVDYLSHVKLNHALNRNLSLIVGMRDGKRVVKPEEFVRVYDILLQVGRVQGHVSNPLIEYSNRIAARIVLVYH